MDYELKLPLGKKEIDMLCAGDTVRVTGVIYTARDAAHKLIVEQLQRGEKMNFDLEGACIYYAGPCPAAEGEVIGPCGPTTSYRMDTYTPTLIAHGQNAMIGKGFRSDEVISAMQGKAVYFAATGGAAVLISKCVKSAEVVAYPELGAEAVRRLYVENLPLVVATDSHGGNLYKR